MKELARKVLPRTLVRLALDSDSKTLAADGNLDPEAAKRLIQTLVGSNNLEALLRLEHAARPGDAPILQYRKDDGNFYPLTGLSVGQKCTALLHI